VARDQPGLAGCHLNTKQCVVPYACVADALLPMPLPLVLLGSTRINDVLGHTFMPQYPIIGSCCSFFPEIHLVFEHHSFQLIICSRLKTLDSNHKGRNTSFVRVTAMSQCNCLQCIGTVGLEIHTTSHTTTVLSMKYPYW